MERYSIAQAPPKRFWGRGVQKNIRPRRVLSCEPIVGRRTLKRYYAVRIVGEEKIRGED